MDELPMMEPDEALSVIDSFPCSPKRESCHVTRACGRVLFESVPARVTMPPFDKAAVDGIGIRDDETADRIRVVGTIPAGQATEVTLAPGEGVRIMTGAPVPKSAGRIVRFEHTTDEDEGAVAWIHTRESGRNIAFYGEDITAGDPLLTPRVLTPGDIGMLAAHGYAQVPVTAPPRVAILATGSELAVPGGPLPTGSIFDSNSYQLAALAEENHAAVVTRAIIEDTPEATKSALAAAVESSDVVIVSGGVSMGERDYVAPALNALGARILFHGLAVKPGRPTLFAQVAGVPVFGLPGNPVSTLVQFELLIRPLLWRMAGATYRPREAYLPLGAAYERKKADRHEYRPAAVRDGRVEPLAYNGSGHLNALADAAAFYRIDRGVDTLKEGSPVYVRFIR